MKDGRPIPVRFPIAVEKWLRVYAIEHDMSLSDVIRKMVGIGKSSTEKEPEPSAPRRRILSRGVI